LGLAAESISHASAHKLPLTAKKIFGRVSLFTLSFLVKAGFSPSLKLLQLQLEHICPVLYRFVVVPRLQLMLKSMLQ
jgi:hypothetical protein